MIESFVVLAMMKVQHLCGVPLYAYLGHHVDEKLYDNFQHDTQKDVLLYEYARDFLMHLHDKNAFHNHHSHNDAHRDELNDADNKLIRLRSVYHILCCFFNKEI